MKLRHVIIVTAIAVLASTAALADTASLLQRLFAAAGSGAAGPGEPRPGSLVLSSRLVDGHRAGEDLPAPLPIGRDLGESRFGIEDGLLVPLAA